MPVDVVIPIPESATTAASSMARALGVKYREAFVKNRYIGRTFIMPNDGQRRSSIRAAIPAERSSPPILVTRWSVRSTREIP